MDKQHKTSYLDHICQDEKAPLVSIRQSLHFCVFSMIFISPLSYNTSFHHLQRYHTHPIAKDHPFTFNHIHHQSTHPIPSRLYSRDQPMPIRITLDIIICYLAHSMPCPKCAHMQKEVEVAKGSRKNEQHTMQHSHYSALALRLLAHFRP